MRFFATLLFFLQAVVCHGQTSMQNLPAAQALSPADLFIVDQLVSPSIRRTGQVPLSAIFSGFTGLPQTWTSPQSFIGSNTAAITADGAQVVVQNSSTTAENILTGNTGGFVYDVMRCALFIPSGNTANNAECFGGYVRNRSAASSTGNGVIYYGFMSCSVSSSSCYGENLRIADSETTAGAGLTGVKLIGTEHDIAVYNTGTTIIGGTVNLTASSVQPIFAAGWDCTGKTAARFTFCFVSEDNSAATALYAGTAGAAGASVASQVITFGYYDSGSTERFPTLNAGSTGAFTWTGPSFVIAPTAATSPGGSNGAATLVIQPAAGQQGILNFYQGSTAEWQIGTLANGHFYAFDVVGGGFIWQMTTGGTFAFTPGISAPSYTVGATAGASCTLTTVSHLTVVNGIVTLCN